VRLALTIALLLGCGRVNFDAREEATHVDAGLESFGPAQPLTPLNTPSDDDDPTITADGLEIYFASQRFGTRDIFVATRDALADPWGPPSRVAELSTSAHEDSPNITPDGLVMLLSSDRPGGPGTGDIYITSRTDRTSPWQPPQLVTELSTPAHEKGASFASTRLEVFLHAELADGSGSRDLYRATRASLSSPFSAPVNVTEVNSAAYDGNPMVAGGDLALWFDSERPGGPGGRDLYLAIRASRSEPFGPPEVITELSTAAAESDLWISEDMRWIVFASDRSGNTDLYEARR
jgi:Tol biopolymer transport system component